MAATHQVVVDLIAKAKGDGFKTVAGDAKNLETKVKSAQTGTSGAMERIGSSGKVMGAAIAAGAIAGGVALAKFAASSVNAYMSTTGAVRAFQRAAGGTAEDASKLVFAIQRVGLAPEKAAVAFGALSRKIGSGKIDLQNFGVQVRYNADGSIDMADAVLQLADSLGNMNANARNSAIFDLFGRQGRELLPLLGKTKGEIEAIFALAGKDHQIFTQNDLDTAAEYQGKLNELNLAFQGVQVQVGRAVIPILKDLTEDVLTPMAQFVADNAEAFAGLAKIVGGVAIPALTALTAVKVGAFFKEGYGVLGDFVGGIGDLVSSIGSGNEALDSLGETSGDSLQTIVDGSSAASDAIATVGTVSESTGGEIAKAFVQALGPVALATAAIIGLGYAFGYFDEVQTETTRSAPKWAAAQVVASQKTVGSLDAARAKYRELGREIERVKARASRVPRGGADVDSIRPNVIAEAERELAGLTAQYNSLRAAIDQFGLATEKTKEPTRAQTQAATVLSDAILKAGSSSDTFANAQQGLVDALVLSSNAKAGDKEVTKQLEDAINRVKAANDRMYTSLLGSVDAHIATQQAEQALIVAIGDRSDALTIASNASTVAKLRVEELSNAIVAGGGAPLDAKAKTELYIAQLKNLAAGSPLTAAALLPLITNLETARDRANAAGEGASGLTQRLKDLARRWDVTVVVSGQQQTIPWSLVRRNTDGSPDLDGNPATLGKWGGGAVKAGNLYQINERGQELFIPATNGRIVNAPESAGRMAAMKSRANVEGSDSVQRLGDGVKALRSRQIIAKAKVEGSDLVQRLGDRVKALRSRQITAKANVEGADLVQRLGEQTDRPKGETVAIDADVNGADRVAGLTDLIGRLRGKTIEVAADVVGLGRVQQLGEQTDRLQSRNVTVGADVEGAERINRLGEVIGRLRDRNLAITAEVTGFDRVRRLGVQTDRLDDKAVSIEADVTGSDRVGGLADRIGRIGNKSIDIAADVTGASLVAQLGDETARLQGRTIQVAADVEGLARVRGLGDETARLQGKTVTVAADVDGADRVDGLGERIGRLKSKTATVAAEVSGSDLVGRLADRLGQLKGKVVSARATVEGVESVQRLADQTDRLKGKAVDVTATVDGLGLVTGLGEQIRRLAGKNVAIAVDVDGAGRVSRLNEQTANLQGKAITVRADVEGLDRVRRLGEQTTGLENKTVTVRADVEGLDRVRRLNERTDELKDKSVALQANVEGSEAVQRLGDRVERLRSREILAKAIVKGSELVERLGDRTERLKDKDITVGANIGGAERVQELLGLVQDLGDKTIAVKVKTVGRLNRDGSPDLDGDPVTPRALGGPVTARKTYLVGENGPELFIPTTSGRILNASQSAARLSQVGGESYSPTYNITVQSLVPDENVGRLVVKAIQRHENVAGTRWRQN